MLFDVYFNEKRDLIVVSRGTTLPSLGLARKWRKSPRRAVRVSDEIKAAIAIQGYYLRRVGDLRRQS
jgi:hypothetical protein